jgi:hypothetical protein
MVSVLQPARAIFDPLDGLSAAVEARRWFWPLLILVVGVSFSSSAFALRWSAAAIVTQQLQMSGELANTTEQELAQKIVTAERTRLVIGVAQGVFVVPVFVVLVAAVLRAVGWLFGTPAAFGKCFSAAAVSMLPIAMLHFILGASYLRQPAVTDAQAQSLVPSNLAFFIPGASAALRSLLASLDFFKLWSAALLGLGFGAASGMRRERALLLGFALYGMYVGVFSVGLPGMRGGPA